MVTYLEFEKGIQKIDQDLQEAKSVSDFVTVSILEKNLEKEISKTYKSLSDYQKLQLARHPSRPYALDYIRGMMEDSYEIHGDRVFNDDPAIVCYIGTISGKKVIVIGEQKGRGSKNKIRRNFGMPQPDGYRKALRVARMAEKFKIPVLFLIDTPGAYPGIGAEERGQSEAIAKNLFELSDLNTITVSIVIGEGGSGGALAIGVADKFAMMRYSVFSVISPEGCAAILWNDPKKQEQATKAMKITAEDLKELNLIDDLIDEPFEGGHRDKAGAILVLKKYFLDTVEELEKLDDETRLDNRYKKLISIGAYVDESVPIEVEKDEESKSELTKELTNKFNSFLDKIQTSSDKKD
ncbi:MAG TPA: acetyl-CoA carboxylase carboxyl transferase subunit alpha [Campylobacterales bacterium]|nr:acetyl-CoA carboxylase carboxyl transferase subunit alpha [Campylobacterales bacterium]HIP60274.1 acetyl-CoA carboxylase carboxyl transferase subunit alpha [Campylobacterales bacterium]